MFKDYYKILDIPQNSTFHEIRIAYHKASKRWHPDVNQEINTTQMMQDINEAYAILKNDATRYRYNNEYELFKKTSIDNSDMDNPWNYSYEVQDEHLKNDINQAKIYAKNLVNEFLCELRENSKNAVIGWSKESLKFFKIFAISIIISIVLVTIARF